jgi:hypothetical protein
MMTLHQPASGPIHAAQRAGPRFALLVLAVGLMHPLFGQTQTALSPGAIPTAGLVRAGADTASWNQFRGPNGSGVAAPGCQPPVKLKASQVVWKTSVPPGLSSPVLAGDRIFLTGLDQNRLVTLALDRGNGNVV